MPLPFPHPLADHDDPPLLIPKSQHAPQSQQHNSLHVVSPFQPAGDQPNAVNQLVNGLKQNLKTQALLGVTGSGKTFTMAKIIEASQRPAIAVAHNKTLAAQLYGEFKAFFPNAAVEYFVSYYDYYQPEAYVARTDTHIEKESSVNERIDRMRHAATRALLERNDVIVVASVSSLFGVGDVSTYSSMTVHVELNQSINPRELAKRLAELQYRRNDAVLIRGSFRVRGDVIEVHPVHSEDRAVRISFFGDLVDAIHEFDPLTGQVDAQLNDVRLYPNSHYVTPKPTLHQAVNSIKIELKDRLKQLTKHQQLIEAQRLEQRTQYDIESLSTLGFCPGIENYSRHLTGRRPGQPPPTLFEYLPKNALLFIDESHATIPQIGGMFRGDFQRKHTLAQHGFRLPSCVDNRPLRFEEWDVMRPQTICVSATPGPWELKQTQGAVVEQIIRPTGVPDPPVDVRPAKSQVDDLLHECRKVVELKGRVLVTALTKRMAEDLAEHLHENNVKTRYLHSDIDTLERIEIIRDLRLGAFHVLVGVNLLREGLDIPECQLVAILDADKEGFLRSETSLIQTVGRAARHLHGRAVLYADKITGSMQRAIDECSRRRNRQVNWNKQHNFSPHSIQKDVGDVLKELRRDEPTPKNARASQYKSLALAQEFSPLSPTNNGRNLLAHIKALEKDMLHAAENLEFEDAARLRDEIRLLSDQDLGLTPDPALNARSSAGKPGTRTLKAKQSSRRTRSL